MKSFIRNKILKLPVILALIIALLGGTGVGIWWDIEAQAAISFESSISAFPESYKSALRTLHSKHPNWTFEAVNTGLDWNTVMSNELVISRNLVPLGLMALKGVDFNSSGVPSWYTTPTSWKSTDINGSYNWSSDKWVEFSGGGWVQASSTAVAYIMDPRNWLTDANVFEFEQLSYNASYQTYDVVKAMLDNTFMDCDYATVGGTNKATYATVIIEAATKYNVSPVSLAARLIQEKGTGTLSNGKYVINDTLGSGVSSSDGGKTFHAAKAGETVYYNFFNIQAAGTTSADVINNGGREAMNKGWTTQYLAIMGGASLIASSKLNIGQDTLYFQKFSVVNKDYLYWNQYMQNLLAPVNEGYASMTTYKAKGLIDSPFTFRIPVYNNMPSTSCARPTPLTSTANPNYKLKSIAVTGTDMFGKTSNLSITPTFSMDTASYSAVVPYETTSVNISATAIAGTSAVSGTESKNLAVGNNSYQIVCKSAYGTSKTYTVNVTRSAASTLLTSLKPTAGGFATTFSKTNLNYTMTVDNSVSAIGFTYTPETSTAKVVFESGGTSSVCEGGKTASVNLPEGTTKITMTVYPSSTDSSTKTVYTINVTRYTKTVFDKKSLQITGSNINGFAIGEKASTALGKMGVTNGTIAIVNSAGKSKGGNELVGTGDYVYVYDANGNVYYKYQIIIYGDVNGDGKIDLFDFAYMKKQILKSNGLTGIYLQAADVYAASKGLDLYDIATIKRYILKNVAIVQNH